MEKRQRQHLAKTKVAQAVGSMGKPQSGFSLVEMMLVLGLATGMTIGALALGNKVYDASRMAQTRDLAGQVAAQVNARFAIFSNYSMLPTTPASSWLTDVPFIGNNVAGPWGTVQLQAVQVNSGTDSWGMTFNNIPTDACVQMLSSMASDYYAVGANGTFSANAPHAAMDPAQAEALCNATMNTVALVADPTNTSMASPVAPLPNPPAASGLPQWTGAVPNAPGAAPAPIPTSAPASIPTPTNPTPTNYTPPVYGGGGCFALGTLVLTSRGPVAIEDVVAGDMVVSQWIEGLEDDHPRSVFAWSAQNLPEACDLAEVLYSHKGAEPGFFRINESLDATWEHPFMVERSGVWRWIRARDLAVGDRLRALEGESRVESVRYIEERLETRNLDVASPYDNFMVKLGDSWILVHNLMMVINKY